ncbi:serine/threonine protein kinase and signal transduction histidine kinase with GAF sensor [Stigmatella aurantiaca]|uniref:histidine kinase n=1 Tax=Stigmatella aurantiaca TaxID=41 RepID=A0A1H7NQE5_STIAU|nr:ATP-binding sensor histidine kinase [Stigmatella aurantiaca]SEL25207.1 serine/threonine protein kinase and signal transduction histidine kinase with GAF sensor [Stigmatella aurantiaca]
MRGITGYELKAQIHRSTRTLVYRARRLADGAPVVLKLLGEEYPSLEDVTRFKREYEIGRKVSGAGAVVVLGLEPVGNSWAIVMEDSEALTLRALLEERRLSLEEALQWGIGLAAALAAVHRLGVLHKDVNPSNIVLEPLRREPRLIDFGLASVQVRETPSLLHPHHLEGTVRYISPEQTGRMNRVIDHRSDLYSLGVTLYEMLTGRVPFASVDTVELVHLHIAQRPLPPREVEPSVPLPVSEVVMKLLAKTAEDRYQSALGLKRDLEVCLAAWRAHAQAPGLGLERFLPGQYDCAHGFQLPQKLYGREVQVEGLRRALDRGARGQAGLVLVSGESGMGKSMLVHEMQGPALERGIHFLPGKFEQLQRDVPYAPLLQAFSDFVRRLLTTSEAELGRWRQRLTEALGENGQVIVDVLPLLARVIGPQPPVPELSSHEAPLRFNLVFQRFVGALVSEQHPLALFLDDLQWADHPSLQFIQMLLTESGLRHLLIVGAYREDEVGPAHPLRGMQKSLEEAGAHITVLRMGPLEPAHVEQLVTDTFHGAAGRTEPLARLLWDRSGGNPLFIGQLLRALYEDGLIGLAPDEDAWTWDLEAIRARGLTDNVVALMTSKLQRLPGPTRQVLELAACLGNRFPLRSLAIVLGCAPGEVEARLAPAIAEDLILPLDSEERAYRFFHDRVQQAAYSLISPEDRAALHLRVARMLLAREAPEQWEEHLIERVHQLNLGLSLVTGEAERCELARLNLLAGRKAKASAAFEPALRYFSVGRSLLPEDAWTRHYALCRDLFMEAMETEYANSRLERGDELSELLLERVREPVEKARVYEVRMASCVMRSEIHRTIEDGYRAMSLLGLELPRNVDLPVLLERLAPVQALIEGRSQDELLNLPPMTEPRWLALCQLSMTMISALYSQNALSALTVSMEMLKLCLLHGNAPEAPSFYVDYGVIQSSILDDMARASELADLVLALQERMNLRRLKCKVYLITAITILHWKRHLRDTLPPLQVAIEAGLETGDMEFLAYSASFLSLHQFYAGLPLDEVLQQTERSLQLMTARKLTAGSYILRTLRQTLLNLMGRSRETTRLLGESFDEARELVDLEASGSGWGLSLLYLKQGLLAYFFRDRARAAALLEVVEPHVTTQVGQFPYLLFHFYQSLALLSAHGGASEADQARFLAQVEKNQARTKHWAEHAPVNSLHRYLLVEAERARVRGDRLSAMQLYEESAAEARKQGFVNEEALCHELAAEFLLSIGRDRLARDSLLEAAGAYRRWGAEAKVADLEKRYPVAFARSRALPRVHNPLTSTSSSGGGDLLDLATVIKAAQAISGEILLDPLLERLMRIVLENAGAQRGLLILVRGGTLVIEAEQAVGSASAARLSSPVEGSALLSPAIVHFVARTRESLVLDNASAEGLFTQDPYVAAHRLRSVLCAPLISQGKLVALLYLENNHVVGAFTEGRLEVLRLLSAQASLSLQNALLFAQMEEYSHTLEQRVEARTRELQSKNEELGRAMRHLRDTQKQLVAQEKLASLGTLTAGIAHELKNPLNFINNFAELALEFTQELSKAMASPPTPAIRQEQDEVLGHLQQNVTKIREHGRRANQIINGMLLHTRELSGRRASAHLNAVLAESVDHGYLGFRAKTPGFEVDIQAEYDPEVTEVDMVVPELSRVFINAVDNACYALRRKKSVLGAAFSPRLAVRTRSQGDFVEVRLWDNGTGIPRHLLGNVFNPFFTTKPAGEGTGLGLSLSHDIVVGGHQGHIRMESQEGEFAELIIELPKRAPAL